jgi:RNA polymerase sigma factor (TIGR02999 family)
MAATGGSCGIVASNVRRLPKPRSPASAALQRRESLCGEVTDLTAILDRLHAGDTRAAGELFDHVYDELKRMAAGQVKRDAGGSVSPTELVHEAYLRLFAGQAPQFNDRAYFFAAAAQAMRRVRVDHARARGAIKRGGEQQRLDLDSGMAVVPEPNIDLVALDEALNKLAAKDPSKAKLVELRFFAGLTMPQVAEVLGVSLATAERQWAYARAWLLAELSGS